MRRPSWPWLIAFALWAPSAGADVPISKQARSHFDAGVRHLTTREPDRFAKAYAELRAAYADSPSWRILDDLGIVAEALERDSEAIQAYRGYLERGGKELRATQREQFKADLERLERGSALVSLQTQPDGAWIVDERTTADGSTVVNRYGPTAGVLQLRLRAGRHRVHAELSSHISETWQFQAHPLASGSHVFELRRADVPSESPPRARPEPFDDQLGGPDDRIAARVLGYGALGLGGVGLGVATVFYLRSLDQKRAGDAAWVTCQRLRPCGAEADARIAEGNELTRSLISVSAAGALLTTGILLLVYAGASSPSEADTLALSPWLSPEALGVTGRF